MPKKSRSSSQDYLAQKFIIREDFERFDQKYDMYNRAVWDENVDSKNFFRSYDMSQCVFRDTEGFTQRDFALRNSSWHLADFTSELKEESEDRREGFLDYYTIQRSGSTVKAEFSAPEAATRLIKRAATFLGAGLVGVCERDERWVYSKNFSRIKKESKHITIPEELKHVVVIGVPMDRELCQTYFSALSGGASGLGYVHDLTVLLSLTQFIRNLGYKAIGSMNDTALSIPLAVQAGLGEYGRHGLLITKAYGPRVRLGKVFTDLPLLADSPVEFGVTHFCNICKRCSDACPPRAIQAGEPRSEPPNKSGLGRLTKWSVDAERCFKYWVDSNSECGICIRICPYNQNYSKRIHRMALPLAGTFMRKVFLRLDIMMGYGKRLHPNEWWGT